MTSSWKPALMMFANGALILSFHFRARFWLMLILVLLSATLFNLACDENGEP